MKIDRIDHIVLTVESVDVTIEFYSRVLGMEPISFADGRRGLAFGVQKINLHSAANPYPEKAQKPTPGLGDFCMITKSPMADVIDHFKAENVEIEVGPIPKPGAIGSLISIYFRDPDGNLLKLSNYLD